MKYYLAVLSVLCVLCGESSFAATPAQDALQSFVNRVETLTAKFEQVEKDEHGEVLQVSSGQLWLSRPGKFRWSYQKPYEQLMVCNGETLWLFDPDLSQVTVRPAGASLQGTPAQLLTDRAALDKQFKIEDKGAEGKVRRVRLVPKAKDSDFQSVELWLQDGVPQRMRFQDPLGGSSDVSFSDVKTNTALDTKLFSFEVPKGVEVIRADEPEKKP
jgi:outer membrane lipoprotein carrier protein